MIRLGYNTNGFAHHRLEDACEIIRDIGYESVAITVERDLLPALDADSIRCAADRLRSILTTTRLRATIETGSRFFLDPRRKHQPTLLSADPAARALRIQYLQSCIDLAAQTSAESVSLWSGAADCDADAPALFERLTAGLGVLLDHARPRGVRLSFEPEPGMFLGTMTQFEQLHDAISDPLFGLTLDVGHVHCLSDGDPATHIRRWRDKLWNIHIEDMRRGIHEHLMFGEGDVTFPPIFTALHEIEYRGPIQVELSRHSHNAVEVARKSFEFIAKF